VHAPRYCLAALLLAGAPHLARADELPIITLTDVGPDQQVPTDRSFYVAGEIDPAVENAQAIVVREGSPSMFGDGGPGCSALLAGLHFDVSSTSDAGDAEGDPVDEAGSAVAPARFPVGVHRAFELFPNAERGVRGLDVLVSAAWRRGGVSDRRYRVLVPHDVRFFAAGYRYCMYVVTTERAQVIDDDTLAQLVDGLARHFVACGDRSSCTDDALDDYEVRVGKELAKSRSVVAGPAGERRSIAAAVKEAARSELAQATGVIEARDHLADRWTGASKIMASAPPVAWQDTASDPFARAVASMLARSSALIPQVRARGGTGAVALYTTDGRLRVRALQVLDDGRSIRVASSMAPATGQARVVAATTDALSVADGVTLHDLIELGQGKIRVDHDWISLTALGARLSSFGLQAWSDDDASYLRAATAQVERLSRFVGGVTGGIECAAKPDDAGAETPQAVRRHLGEWLACQHVDAGALAALARQLDELVTQDRSWRATKQDLVTRARRVVTLTTTSPIAAHVAFSSRTWVFSYVTPMIGYAGIVRPGESFGLFYLGAQIHLDPNPVDDVLWHDGITPKDLRRAFALEVGVAPYGASFGPAGRFSGPGALPPIMLGLALHVIPYTSFTVGGLLLDRKRSTIPEEQPHTIFAPYLGVTLQLNLPDLIWQAAHPSSDTSATR
jgi:hypothetical protein